MKLSESAWQESTAVYEEIVLHPFNVPLMNGPLPADPFQFYIAHDSVFVNELDM